jgi:hypothetical protein
VKPSVALTAALLALAVPASASAAELGVQPDKRCYRSGEQVSLGGTGFTPGGPVDVSVDGTPLTGSPATADATGSITGELTVGQRTGQKRKTYTATDRTNPALTASETLLVSALRVSVRPRSGVAGRRVKIVARGFTTGKRLYAHIVRRGTRRNVQIARLKGACRKATARKRLFGPNTPSGRYRVQFDTRRRYSASTRVYIRFNVDIFPSARGATAGAEAAAASARWTRVG